MLDQPRAANPTFGTEGLRGQGQKLASPGRLIIPHKVETPFELLPVGLQVSTPSQRIPRGIGCTCNRLTVVQRHKAPERLVPLGNGIRRPARTLQRLTLFVVEVRDGALVLLLLLLNRQRIGELPQRFVDGPRFQ